MSKPYQNEIYDQEDNTKEYINLFSLGPSLTLGTAENSTQTFTLGSDEYDGVSSTNTGKFNVINKTSSINYSNGIITVNKSGNYRLIFNGVLFLDITRALLFTVKKNEISIAEVAIQISRNTISDGTRTDSVMFLSPIFSVSIGDNIRIIVSIDDNCGIMINQNLFLQEI